jgi:hypothetical protein
MLEKAIVPLLLAISLLALANAAIVSKRSYYLESDNRVDLERLTDNIEQLDRDRMLRLSKRLVVISKSDSGILLLLNREFRRAVLGLSLSLVSLLLYVLFLQVRTYFRNREAC